MRKKSVMSVFLSFLMLLSIVPVLRGNFVQATGGYPEVWVDDNASPGWYDANHVATIQEAVSIVEEGGTIYILPGNYNEGIPITINKGMHLLGYGSLKPTIGDDIEITDANGVTIEELQIFGGLSTNGVDELTVLKCFFGGDVDLEYTSSILVEGSIFSQTSLNGYYIRDVTIKENTFSYGNYGIYMDYGGRALIEDNTFLYHNTAIYLDTVSFTTIRNNNITSDSGSYGIHQEYGNENIIEENRISWFYRGIYSDYSHNTVIRGNEIHENGYGLDVRYGTNNIVMYNNVSESGQDTGILLYTEDYSSVLGNIISRNHYGLRVESSQNLSLFSIPRVAYEWISLNKEDADLVLEGDDQDVYYETGDYYQLPFTFPFFGKNITAIDVNTNGLIELLGNGGSCQECDNYETHADGEHIGEMDAIFAFNDDLAAELGGYVAIFNLTDRVVIDFYLITYEDWDLIENITEAPLRFQVVLYSDGRIRWNIKEFKPIMNDGDLWTGIYEMDSNVEGVIEDQLRRFDVREESSYEFDGSYDALQKNILLGYNIIEYNNVSGIRLGNAMSVEILGNDIRSSIQDGIVTLGGTSNVRVQYNDIKDNFRGIYTMAATPLMEVHHNNIAGNDIGIYNPVSDAWVNATLNWWGAPDGPSPIEGFAYTLQTPTGSGDRVSNNVYFDPWLTEEVPREAKIVYSNLKANATNITPGGSVEVSTAVSNEGNSLGTYVAEFKVDGKVKASESGMIIPGYMIPLKFTYTFNDEGEYHVTVDGLNPIVITVGKPSEGTNIQNIYTIAIAWSVWFFKLSDEFEEKYDEAQEMGVDNGTLQNAMNLYEQAKQDLLDGWGVESLEYLEQNIWSMRGVYPRIFEIRHAYMEIKEAIAILDAAMEEL